MKILELLEKGVITSTSVMIKEIDKKQDEQIKKLKEIKKSKDITVGLHFEFESDDFGPQIKEQHKQFVKIFGFEPDHVDIHKSTYLENGYPEVMKFALAKGIPCKNLGIEEVEALMTDGVTFSCAFKSKNEILNYLRTLEDGKTYLLEFHPGIYDPDCRTSWNEMREDDAKNALKLFSLYEGLGIELVNFNFLKK